MDNILIYKMKIFCVTKKCIFNSCSKKYECNKCHYISCSDSLQFFFLLCFDCCEHIIVLQLCILPHLPLFVNHNIKRRNIHFVKLIVLFVFVIFVFFVIYFTVIHLFFLFCHKTVFGKKKIRLWDF